MRVIPHRAAAGSPKGIILSGWGALQFAGQIEALELQAAVVA